MSDEVVFSRFSCFALPGFRRGLRFTREVVFVGNCSFNQLT
jgi:hypothetical protein